MDQPVYTFTKETYFNNNGAFGSDITRYKVFQNGEEKGRVSYDIYYRKTHIHSGIEEYEISAGFFQHPALRPVGSSKKLAKIRVTSLMLTGKFGIRIKFNDGTEYNMSIEDLISEKTCCTRLYTHDSDIVYDFALSRPRPDIRVVREMPLEGEIFFTGKETDLLHVLCGLALLEMLIVFSDNRRNDR